MKKNYFSGVLLFSLVVLMQSTSRAQLVDNSSFEDWSVSATTGRLVPDGWESSDDDYTFASVVQSTGHTGTYSTRLKYVGTDAAYVSIYAGPVTAKPFAVTGYWRDKTGGSTDQGSCTLFVYDSLSQEDGSTHTPFLSEIPNWQQFICIAPVNSLTHPPYYFDIRLSCEAINASSWVDVDDITLLLTGVDELDATLGNYSISPSVSSGKFQVSYCTLRTTPVSISVFDITGNKIRDVFNGVSRLGNHSVNMELDNLNSGIYFCRIDTDKGGKTVKFIVQN